MLKKLRKLKGAIRHDFEFEIWYDHINEIKIKSCESDRDVFNYLSVSSVVKKSKLRQPAKSEEGARGRISAIITLKTYFVQVSKI